MEKPEGYFLGYFSKTHGIAGGILLRSDVLLPEDIEETEFVFVNFDQILVPFFVSAIEVKNDETAVLFLRDVAGDDLKELIGREVYLEDGYSVEKTNDPLAGYHIVDMNSDFSGEIEGLEDIPGNPLFRIRSGNKEILIPIVDEFIREIDDSKKLITVELPPGLIDL